MSQVVVLNCIFDKIHQYLDRDLPLAIEKSVRKTIGVEITLPGPVNNDLLLSPKSPSAMENKAEELKVKKKVSSKKPKKAARAPGELCYHTEFKQVEKCYNALIENANIREKYAPQA